MKKIIFCLLFAPFLFSCNNQEEQATSTSENDIDAARNFIRSALDGDYKKARDYMIQDSLNTQLLNTFESNYQMHMNREDKRGYREASIRIPDVRKVSDTVSVVQYSNSYKNKLDSLKVVRVNNQWLVDCKYSVPIKETAR
jgi:hypothetical protein